MNREYNYQAFTPEEVEDGLLQDLFNYLLSYNSKCKSGFYEICITSDGYCTIVEWSDINYQFKHEQGRFKYVPSNGQIMLEYDFPDGHYEMCYDEEDYEQRLQDWLKENPGWVKTAYGTWTNEIENEQYRKQLEEKYVNQESEEETTDDKE